MRIAAIEKLGYYPTPPQTLRLITQALTPAGGSGSTLRLLDPCAGQGEALASIATHLRNGHHAVTSYGIELAEARAPLAADVLDHVLHADYRDANLSQYAWGLLYLNPPYDHEAGNVGTKKHRQEYTFLRDTLVRLQTGGVLVYVVPISLLASDNVCRVLAANFDELSVWRLPAEEFDTFGQIVIFGLAREQPQPNQPLQRLLHSYTLENLPPSLADFDRPPYVVPASPVADSALRFRKLTLSYAEILTAVTTKGAHSNPLWRDWTKPASELSFRPVVPLRTGHVASLISSGQMGTVKLGTIVAKGRAVKQLIYLDHNGNEVDANDPTMHSSKERFITQVHTLNLTGEHQVIESVAAMEAFLANHGPAIAQAISQQYQPLYSEPTVAEWSHLSRLMRHKRLPGRSEGGFLPAQKHVAIAAVRSLRAQGWVDIIAEMGFGKTSVSLAALDLANAYPAIVLCPSHMTEKWAREARDVIPGVRAEVVNNLAQLQRFVARYRSGEKAVAVLSKEKAKLGPGWRVAVAWRPRRIVTEHDRLGRPLATGVVKLPSCPACGALITDKEGVPQQTTPTKPVKCHHCDAPLYEFHGLRRWPLADYIRRHCKGFFHTLIADEFHQFKGASTDQAESYHHLVLATKYQINLTGTLFGGKSTDLFWLRYRIDPKIRQEYAFTDTQRWAEHYGRLERTFNTPDDNADYGSYNAKKRFVVNTKEIPGISPAIFARLLNSCIFVRITDLGYQLPAYHEEIHRLSLDSERSAQYELLHTTLYAVIQSGVGWEADPLARQRARAMLSVWLQNCLSRPNATFRAETVHWSPEGERVPFMVDPSMLDLPADEVPELDEADETPFVLPPIAGLSPKEQALIRLAQAEIRQGRKLILGVRQTGTRDIQPHLQQLLNAAGIRAVILPDSLAPAKREGWIAQHLHNIDVLITNPKKVETGIDLVAFATIVCYEAEYSLFTLWQFMRRVWRLGQTQPVRIVFLVYQHTLEAAALALIGEKMKAALLLYGDNAASAITADADAGEASLLNELANRILAGEQFTADGVNHLLAPTIADETSNPLFAEPAIVEPTTIEPTINESPSPAPTHQPTIWEAAEPSEALPSSHFTAIWARIAPPRKTKQAHDGSAQLSFLELAL
jgi:hypothetical protein